MKKFFSTSHLLFFPLILAPLVLTGCSHQVSIEQTTSKVKEEAQSATDAAKNAVTGAVTSATEQAVDQAVNEAKETASEQVNAASEAVKDATNQVKGAVDGETEPERISMTASKFEFSPSTITVKEGTPVEISVTSKDVSHGFSLSEFGVDETIEAGKISVITFTPNQVGEFSFSCSTFCGSGHSTMQGKLIVTE